MTKKALITTIIVGILVVAAIVVLIVINNRKDESTPADTASTATESGPAAADNYIDVDSPAAYELLSTDQSIAIIDVSPRYAEGHLPKSVNYYVGDGSLDKAIPDLDKSLTYLVYCHVDSASISGAQKLVDAGFAKVYRLEGNYATWFDGGYPIEIELKAVGNYSGSALAARSFLNGRFQHDMVATLADPAPGKFYEGWLVKGTSFFSTGKLEKSGDEYFLSYSSDEDSRDYKQVVVTEETESLGLDGKPETHVLEGSFK